MIWVPGCCFTEFSARKLCLEKPDCPRNPENIWVECGTCFGVELCGSVVCIPSPCRRGDLQTQENVPLGSSPFHSGGGSAFVTGSFASGLVINGLVFCSLF